MVEISGLAGLKTDPDGSRGATPEQRLVRAVLELAIDDARKGSRNALAWLASDDDAFWNGWSFRAVCQHLDAEPSWVRRIAAEYIAAHPHVPRRRRREGTPATALAA